MIYKSSQNFNQATDKQRRVITRLCVALKIKEHLEERQMTQAEAGELIRRMSAQVSWSKRR